MVFSRLVFSWLVFSRLVLSMLCYQGWCSPGWSYQYFAIKAGVLQTLVLQDGVLKHNVPFGWFSLAWRSAGSCILGYTIPGWCGLFLRNNYLLKASRYSQGQAALVLILLFSGILCFPPEPRLAFLLRPAFTFTAVPLNINIADFKGSVSRKLRPRLLYIIRKLSL